MKKIWLVTDKNSLETLLQAGQDAFMFDAVGSAPGEMMAEREVVVIGRGIEAKEKALTLKSRGIADVRLSYIDMGKGESLWDRLDNPKHLHWDDVCTLAELPPEKEVKYYPTGFDYLGKDLKWNWRLPEVVVMAGAYGCGKSTMLQMLAAGWANGAGRKIGGGAMMCSWEDASDEVKRNMAAFGKSNGVTDMHKLVSFVRRNPDDDRLVAWYMDLVRYHRERFGTRFFCLDPWNEMDHVKDVRQAETDYVRDMMKAFRRLADKLQIILIIATHVPAKNIKGDGSIEPFKIAQAFGSVQFANKADRGLCVVRTKKFNKTDGHTILRLDKAKIERTMGKRGTIALRLDVDRFQFEYDGHVTAEVREVWKD